MLALALLLAAGPVQPTQDTLRYTFESVNTQDIDASAAGQGTMQNEMKFSGKMHVVVRDTTGGKLAHVVIDTAEFSSSNPQMAMLPMRVAPGTAFHLYVVDGEIKSGMTPPEMNLGVAQVMGVIGNLYPKIRHDVAVGGTWTDTTTTDSVTAGGRITNRAVTEWTVSSAQGKVRSLTGHVTGSITAEMQQGTMTGATTGTLQLVAAPGEPIRRSESTINADVQMMMGQMAVALKQQQHVVIARTP